MILINGASDDLVYFSGQVAQFKDFNGETQHPSGSMAEEICCYDQSVKLIVSNEDGAVVVVMRYASTPGSMGWTAEIMQSDLDAPIPWPVSVRTVKEDENLPEYSVIVEIDCPNDVSVTWDKM